MTRGLRGSLSGSRYSSLASSSVTFQNLVPLLEEHHRVISIDILGFGRSPVPTEAEYTLEEHVAALRATIRELRLRRPYVLVGHSLGSLIVARYTAEHPERISRLILVAPPVYDAPESIGDHAVRIRVGAYLKAYEFMRRNKEFTLANAAVIARLLPIKGVFEITEQNWVPFTKSLERCIERQTVTGDVARVRVPVDLVYGRFDAFIAPGALATIEAMRHVESHVVRANDHLIRPRMARVVAAAVEASTATADAGG